jgi:hypothetical protein
MDGNVTIRSISLFKSINVKLLLPICAILGIFDMFELQTAIAMNNKRAFCEQMLVYIHICVLYSVEPFFIGYMQT